MSAVVLYPGTFDPITHGHLDIVQRAAKIFPKLILAVANHTAKQTLFSFEERVSLAEQSVAELTGIKVVGFSGLLVDFARAQQATVILRGLRAIADFEYERQLTSMNQELAPELETVFLTPTPRYSYISSTFVREIASLKGEVNAFVNPIVAAALKEKFSQKVTAWRS